MNRHHSENARKLDHRDTMNTEKDISVKLPLLLSVFIVSLWSTNHD